MRKPESVLWDFEIQTGHLISTKPSDSKKKTAELLTLPLRMTTTEGNQEINT